MMLSLRHTDVHARCCASLLAVLGYPLKGKLKGHGDQHVLLVTRAARGIEFEMARRFLADGYQFLRCGDKSRVELGG